MWGAESTDVTVELVHELRVLWATVGARARDGELAAPLRVRSRAALDESVSMADAVDAFNTDGWTVRLVIGEVSGSPGWLSATRRFPTVDAAIAAWAELGLEVEWSLMWIEDDEIWKLTAP
jgi:hypothetical protein